MRRPWLRRRSRGLVGVTGAHVASTAARNRTIFDTGRPLHVPPRGRAAPQGAAALPGEDETIAEWPRGPSPSAQKTCVISLWPGAISLTKTSGRPSRGKWMGRPHSATVLPPSTLGAAGLVLALDSMGVRIDPFRAPHNRAHPVAVPGRHARIFHAGGRGVGREILVLMGRGRNRGRFPGRSRRRARLGVLYCAVLK